MKSSVLKTNPRRNALLVLLLVPVPSIGVAIELYFLPGPVGNLVALGSRIWLLVVPIIWLFSVERGNLKVQYAKRRDLLPGVGLGLLMLSIILLSYWLLGPQWIDLAFVRERARQVGVGSMMIYSIGAAYWVFINSLQEEFVWRWFIYRKCEILVPGWKAVILSALFFMLHHVVSLAAYFDWRVTTIGGLAVFSAGAVWSWCYLTYRSIWPGYISHVFADIAVFIVGWQLLFG